MGALKEPPNIGLDPTGLAMKIWRARLASAGSRTFSGSGRAPALALRLPNLGCILFVTRADPSGPVAMVTLLAQLPEARRGRRALADVTQTRFRGAAPPPNQCLPERKPYGRCFVSEGSRGPH